ncbi:MAG TPA: hypothetical protein VGL38_09015 [bacterium]|jgi:hypothetical protein
MNSMQDFALVTQAAEYIVGMTGLLLFALLWKALSKPKKGARA